MALAAARSSGLRLLRPALLGPKCALGVLAGRRGFSARIDGYMAYYGKLKNQEGMLRDTARNEAYRAAFEAAVPRLKGATVMDIGTGSGILALLAAKYGAAKVYAIEGSPEIARVASRLARANGYVGVIEVVPKHLEDVTHEDIPSGSVDIIVSELFSHFLVGEVGLQVVTMAKQRFLRPGGLILPEVSWLKLSPFEDPALGAELRGRHKFWQQQDFMGFDLTSVLPIAEEQQLKEMVLDIVDPDELLISPEESPGECLDLVGPDDPDVWKKIEFEVKFPDRKRDALIDGLCGWWDAIFSGDCMGDNPPVLSTAPGAPPTVWAQCRFLLDKPLRAAATDKLSAKCVLQTHKQRESYSARFELRNDSTNKVSRIGPVELSNVYARHFAKSNSFPLVDEGAAADGGTGGRRDPLRL